MANSIKRQLVVVFVGLIAMLLSVVFIVNSIFLGDYYIIHKKSDMIEMYRMIDAAITTGNVVEEEQQKEIAWRSERDRKSVV